MAPLPSLVEALDLLLAQGAGRVSCRRAHGGLEVGKLDLVFHPDHGESPAHFAARLAPLVGDGVELEVSVRRGQVTHARLTRTCVPAAEPGPPSGRDVAAQLLALAEADPCMRPPAYDIWSALLGRLAAGET